MPPFTRSGGETINTRTSDLQQWSTFWQQGHITTFGASKPDNYDGVIRDFWRDKFRELPDDANILDIATGNGAIATLAAELSKDRSKNFKIRASDRAVINTQIVGSESAAELRELIEFHSETPCEKQPFDDDSFDLVTSQFGFEYSDIDATLQEVRRVLAASGWFIAISHHADSQLIKAASKELGVYEQAIDQADLFGKLRAYTEALGDLTGNQEELVGKIQAAAPLAAEMLQSLKQLQADYPDEDCAAEIGGTISYLSKPQQAQATDRVAAIDASRSDFSFAQARLKDMVDAALSQDEIEQLTIVAKEAGFRSVHCLKIFGEDHALAGWQIHMR